MTKYWYYVTYVIFSSIFPYSMDHMVVNWTIINNIWAFKNQSIMGKEEL